MLITPTLTTDDRDIGVHPNFDEYLTLEQAAKVVNRTPYTLKNYTKGQPPKLRYVLKGNKIHTTRRWLHRCLLDLDYKGAGAMVKKLPDDYIVPTGEPNLPKAEEGYISSAEAARLLGVSRQRVSKMIGDGLIPSNGGGQTGVLVPRNAVLARLSNPTPTGTHLS